MRNRQSHWLVLTYIPPSFDFSKSVRANADKRINMHESSSSLILSAFYIVLSRIHSMIIILCIIDSCSPFFTETLNVKKAPPPALSSVKMVNVHSYMVTKF